MISNHFEFKMKPRKKGGYLSKGPSINDVSSVGEGGGFKNLQFGAIFKAYLGRQGEGGWSKIAKIGATTFMDGPLSNHFCLRICIHKKLANYTKICAYL